MSRQQLLKFGLYSGLVLLIMGPLIVPGFLFALDMVFTPGPSASEFAGRPSFLFYALIDLFKLIFPADVVQKIMLLAVFGLSIWGIDRLVRYLLKNVRLEVLLLSVVVYVCNPFVYSRFMTGQFSVLLGYALLPFFALAVLRWLHDLSWRRTALVALWATGISIVSIHTLLIAAIVGLPLVCLYLYRHWKNWRWYKIIATKSLAILGIFGLVNSYWLIPALFGQGTLSQTVNSFGNADFTAFATSGQNLGVLGNVLAMQGFWADAANLYVVPQDRFWWWWIPLLLLGLLVLVGIYRGWQAKRGVTIALLLSFALATILACGPSGTIFGPINQWFLAHLPFFAGYREPQKFIAVITLVYAIFAGFGVWQITAWLTRFQTHKSWTGTLGLLGVIIPIACAPLMLWGFSAQLKPRDYPKDWYALNQDFAQQGLTKQKVLGLPWRLYMRFDFAGRVIANPMDRFFAPQVIISADPEFGNIQSHLVNDPIVSQLNEILAATPDHTMATQLQQLDISFVLLAKEGEYHQYDYLNNQPGLKLVNDTENLRLYKVEPGRL